MNVEVLCRDYARAPFPSRQTTAARVAWTCADHPLYAPAFSISQSETYALARTDTCLTYLYSPLAHTAATEYLAVDQHLQTKQGKLLYVRNHSLRGKCACSKCFTATVCSRVGESGDSVAWSTSTGLGYGDSPW